MVVPHLDCRDSLRIRMHRVDQDVVFFDDDDRGNSQRTETWLDPSSRGGIPSKGIPIDLTGDFAALIPKIATSSPKK